MTALLDYGSKLTPTAPRRPPTPALRRVRRDRARWLAGPLQITAHEGEGLLDRLGAAVLGTLGRHRVQNCLENDELVIRLQTAEAMRRVTLSLANPHTPLPTGQDLRRETCAVNLS